MVDEVLRSLSREFDRMYCSQGRPSIAPQKLLRALVVQMLYSIRSEPLLMAEIEYNRTCNTVDCGLPADPFA